MLYLFFGPFSGCKKKSRSFYLSSYSNILLSYWNSSINLIKRNFTKSFKYIHHTIIHITMYLYKIHIRNIFWFFYSVAERKCWFFMKIFGKMIKWCISVLILKLPWIRKKTNSRQILYCCITLSLMQSRHCALPNVSALHLFSIINACEFLNAATTSSLVHTFAQFRD